MNLLFALLRQIWALLLSPAARRSGIDALMAEAERKIAEHILERAMAMNGLTLDRTRYDCRVVWNDGVPDFVLVPKPGFEPRPQFHPRRLRILPSRRPRVPNRWNKTRATCILRLEHRRNRRSERVFLHATPIAPAIREPRVIIPPW